ncbi:MAG: putative transporter [Bacteroidaceae bacterium]|nr:putative transporter [Bacteroidaceae bacterium]
MNWLQETFLSHSAVQAVIIISLICAIGLSLGKIRFRGITLGVTFVLYIGILAGSLGLSLDPSMLGYAESFGLVLFVYTLGLQVGPGFISSFRIGGRDLTLLSLGVVLLGTLMALIPVWFGQAELPDMMGVLCGATTNTPALGAAQQTLKQLGQPDSVAALSCAVTYPLGMVGVILAFIIMKGWLVRREKPQKDRSKEKEAFIASFQVCNPAVFHRSLHEVAGFDESKFVVSRIWRSGKVILPTAETVIEEGDRVLVITQQRFVEQLTIFFGSIDDTDWNKQNIDWNALDSKLVSQRILITRPSINGKHLGDLHLRNRYGVNVSRVLRAGIQLVATPQLTLRVGDRVTVVGEQESLKRVAKELGNAVKHLDEPNMVTIFIGIVLGLVLGCLPIEFPGISYPVRLGLAGGPIIMGILIGAFGPRFHMVAYTTTSANLMLRSLGLSIYLACLGLAAGADFVETVMQPRALWWIAYGLLITLVPVILLAVISVKWSGKTVASTAGMLCGAMANPIALGYVNDVIPGDKASVSYATVYPLCMFLRVVIAQVVVMMWFT